MNRLCVYPRLRFLHSHPGYLGAAVRHVAREGKKRYNANRRRAGIHIMRSELDLLRMNVSVTPCGEGD
jgi:hypothetical protein